jgi:hypothetical protein
MFSVSRTFRNLALVGMIAGLGAVALAATDAAKTSPASSARHEDRVQARKDWIQHRLDSAASRLEIKASQQSAWQAYAAAVQALGETDKLKPTQPDADADAATIARERAERATAFAARLTAIADATARLQGVLSPEQKSTLKQITREAGPHHGSGGLGRPMTGRPMMDDRGPMEHAQQ